MAKALQIPRVMELGGLEPPTSWVRFADDVEMRVPRAKQEGAAVCATRLCLVLWGSGRRPRGGACFVAKGVVYRSGAGLLLGAA